MKKTFLYFAIFLFSASLYSAEPLVKFYLNDGSTKQYNLSEINSLGVIDKKNNYVLRIHYDDTLIAYYPTEIIGSIKFENDSLNVYIFSYPKSYLLSSIDSLIFYIDQWQPLTIGSQVWMLKNLNVDHYRNGDSIPEVRNNMAWINLKTSAWSYYNNSDSLGSIFGKLYNWYAVNDNRVIAPVGWHVPNDDEWITLTAYLGGESVTGSKLKEKGYKHWWIPNIGATNESGFSALPCGFRDGNGKGSSLGGCSSWWSSSEYHAEGSWSRSLYPNDSTIARYFWDKENGLSIRCVKDKP